MRLKAKAWWRKGRWGLGFRRARCLAGSGNMRGFKVLAFSANARQFCILVRKIQGQSIAKSWFSFTLRSERSADAL